MGTGLILLVTGSALGVPTEFRVDVTKTMRGRYTSAPSQSPQWCEFAAANAGMAAFYDDPSTPSCFDMSQDSADSCDMSWGAWAGAGAGCGQSGSTAECGAYGGRIYYTSALLPVPPFLTEETSTQFGCVADSNCHGHILGSWAAASPSVNLTNVTAPIEYLSEMTYVITSTASKRRIPESDPLRRVAFVVSTPSGVVARRGVFNSTGLTIEGLTPTAESTGYMTHSYTFTLASGLASGSSQTFESSSLVVQDSAYDVNGDGAFDANDVQWVRDHFRAIDIDTENPYTVKGNFVVTSPEPEAIDEDDADFLDSILDQIGPSCKFGDFNRDGVVDCHDAWGSSAYFGVSIGDPDYRYELDSNRDGTVDSDDKAAFFALVNHCDFNQDEVVDDSDMVIFTAAYNLLDCEDPAMPAYCPADLNLDGYVDDADFLLFLVRYENLEC